MGAEFDLGQQENVGSTFSSKSNIIAHSEERDPRSPEEIARLQAELDADEDSTLSVDDYPLGKCLFDK